MFLSIIVKVSLVFAAMLVFSCGGVQRPQTEAPCIKPNQKQLMVRWGTAEENGVTTGYELDSRAELWTVTISGPDTIRKHAAVVDVMLYCQLAADVNTTFLKTQALHSPGTRARYVEYINPATTVYLRAVWNPDLSTFQSRDMRSQYDELMKLVPKD